MKSKQTSLKALLFGVTLGTLSLVLLGTTAKTEPVPANLSPINVEPSATPTPAAETINTNQNTAPVNAEPSATPTPASAANVEATNALSPTEVKILTPAQGTVLEVPAVTITAQYAVGATVELKINGVLADSSSIGRTETDPVFNTITQTWYGISVKEGENTITVQAKNNGAVGELVSVTVQVPSTPTQLTLETVEARIPADGRSTATIQGQLIDKNGNRSIQDATVTLESNVGEFIGVDAALEQPGFQIEAKKGQFSATLRSSLEAQTARIRATTDQFEAFTQLQFETNLRPSIVTGVIDFRLGARGTNYYDSFREFLPPDKNNRYEIDARGSVFATGRVLGDWLLTGAYNSDRTLNEGCNDIPRVGRDVQSCDRQYSVYGDTSRVDALTPSKDSLYLRLERSANIRGADPNYFMWGDYNTSEFARRSQEFSATTRQLHGFKANYNLGNLQITGLYANDIDGFQRDTIAPDGTSGYYFLSRRLLIPGTENVFIELEELDRPGTVLERRQLNRGVDYEIDYDRGTLLFREPILRTDVDDFGRVLVRRIVSTYEYESGGSNSLVAARARYNFSRELNQESWVGATFLQENQGVRNFSLYGADTLISIGPKASIIAEYARSNNDSEILGFVSGSAYRVEAQGELFPGVQARAFYRSAETGFANNATVSFVPGQTRYGAQVIAKVSPTTNVRVQYDHEDNRGIAPEPLTNFPDLYTPRPEPLPGSQVDNSLTTIAAGVEQQIGKATVGLDFIHRNREDRLATSPLSSTSNQLRSRLTVPLTDTLTFRAQNELNLSSSQDLVYPDRTILGLNWAVMPGVNLAVNQIFFSGGQYENNSITSIDLNGQYKLGEDTTLIGRTSLINGQNLAGSVGLQQGWTIAKGLRADFTYEHIFGNLFNRTGAGVQFPQPFAPGQSASSIGVGGGDSYSVGLAYTGSDNFQAAARYEHRTSSSGSNTVISASATGKISPAITGLFSYQQASSANQTLTGLGDTANLKIGVAYRDLNNDSLNALLRYEYRKNPATIPDTLLFGSGTGSEDHVFGAEAIYAPNWQWEFYGKYAVRNSTSYLAQDLVGNSTVSLAQLRATYRLGYNMDLVGEARWINQPTTGYSETGLVLEAGYYLTPNLRLSAGYAFGRVDDRDFNGSRSAGGPYLGLTVKLDELFDGFGLQKAPPPQQKEPQEPVAEVSKQEATPQPETANLDTPVSDATAQPSPSTATASEDKIAPVEPTAGGVTP